MSFQTEITNGVAVVTVTCSRLDASVAPELKTIVGDVVGKGTSRIIIDLDSVQFMDSSGLGAVISSFKLTGQKGEFVICNMNDSVKQIFTLTHMDRLFEIYPSVNEGFERLCA